MTRSSYPKIAREEKISMEQEEPEQNGLGEGLQFRSGCGGFFQHSIGETAEPLDEPGNLGGGARPDLTIRGPGVGVPSP